MSVESKAKAARRSTLARRVIMAHASVGRGALSREFDCMADRLSLSENGVMKDLEQILKLWQELEPAGAEFVLATVVAVEGPSYRKPGAHMLLAPDGRRAGTVSGGCLESEVAKRAWWFTENGPIVQRYSTVEDDGERPYGSGCGGTVWLLLERSATANPLLQALK